jgi:prephenate dehydrogenase
VSKQKPRITIVGLGLIGGSMGLALRQADVASAVVGHDKEPGASAQAKKIGAVDKTDWNLISACEDSQLIILATPLSAIKPTLEAIAPYLQPGCVVMDTASLKEVVLDWASETLPEHVDFVGGDPIISASVEAEGGLEAARSDLFQDGLFCLTPSATAEPDAVSLASDLVLILGAKPLFLDPAEHDGLVAAVEHLPAIMDMALLETVIRQPSWRELRKVAGASFEASTQLASRDPTSYADLCLSNRDNILRWIDAYSGALATIRQDLVEGECEVLAQRFEIAGQERNRWLLDRASGDWEGTPDVEMPGRSDMISDVFLGRWWRKRQRKDE